MSAKTAGMWTGYLHAVHFVPSIEKNYRLDVEFVDDYIHSYLNYKEIQSRTDVHRQWLNWLEQPKLDNYIRLYAIHDE